MNTLARPRPLVVVILDGWGISLLSEGNAPAAASTPTMDSFARTFPTTALAAAGLEVGLPWGDVGNSEVGHRNIGAGYIHYQILPAIDRAIERGSFFTNAAFVGALDHARSRNSSLHLMGLLSPSGVHSHMHHLFALLRLAAEHDFRERVYLHLFTDGRDSPPTSALTYLQQLEEAIGACGVGVVASVTGRFYAMDRGKNWDRTAATFSMLTGGERPPGAPSARRAIEAAYAAGLTDEMIPPTALTRGGGPLATIRDGDAVIFFNFRPDRAVQLTRAFVQPDHVGFPAHPPEDLYFATMTSYAPDISAPAAWREEAAAYPLARVLSDAQLQQLHVAETEKYAHVTYYLNVGHMQPFPGEKHHFVPSSHTAHFSQEPHMAAEAITDYILSEISRDSFDVYFVNYANADMVGHTGDFAAGVAACTFLDQCLERLREAVFAVDGALIVTADHGNIEEMVNPHTHAVETDHTNNPVPFHYVRRSLARTSPRSDARVAHIFSSPQGVLSDVAPTILDVLHLDKPASMTGVSLLDSLQ